LRVRHREVVVVTTMFWRQALEEARARTLVERFRHPLVYALLLALALFAWASVAGPRANRSDGEQHLFLLDLSTPVTSERFDETVRALSAEVARAERDERRVVACGERLETLLAPGEDELLLAQRLALVAPGSGAPSVERALLAFGVSREGELPIAAHVFGAAPVRAEVVQRLGGTRVERVAPRDTTTPIASATVSAVTCARSDLVRGRVDVWVDVANAPALLSLDAALVRGNSRETLAPTRVEALDGGAARAVFESVVADGALFEAALPGTNALASARRAALVLPDLAPLRVAVGPGLPQALVLVLTSHPDIAVTQSDAEVAVCAVGDPLAAALPALEVGAPLSGPAIELVHTGAADARGLLFSALGDLGLDTIDLGAVAALAGRPVEFVESSASRRGLVVWRELFESDAAFVASAEFPLFVARVLEWLAARPEAQFAPRAGEALAGVVASYREVDGEVVLDPLAGAFTPPRAGAFERVDDRSGDPRVRSAALVSAGPAAVSANDDLGAARSARSAPIAAFDLANLILLVLAALFVVEWWLVRSERIA
jgi:hypothetical protein